MKTRKTSDTKTRFILIRTTLDEHTAIKIKAAEKGVSMSAFVLNAVEKSIEKTVEK